MNLRMPAFALVPALAATPALAHVGVHEGSTFLAGLLHPIGGVDHVLAMVAVGIWSALAGGRARFAWPLAFVAAMLGGFALTAIGAALPLIEPGIVASLVVFGLLIALAVRVPTAVGAAVVAVFAVFHGAAHGLEAPGGNLAGYALGFALATAALHLAGLGYAQLDGIRHGRTLLRAGGAVTAAAGLALAYAA